MFEIKKKQCKTCIYKKGNEELRDTVESRVSDSSHQNCHSQKGEVCCRGFYENVQNQKIRMAERFNIVQFVD